MKEEDPRIKQLREMLANVEKPEADALDGFDLSFVGFDCLGAVERWDWDPWTCPFQPGCGAKRAGDCAVAKQLAKVHKAPKRMQ